MAWRGEARLEGDWRQHGPFAHSFKGVLLEKIELFFQREVPIKKEEAARGMIKITVKFN
jgi:hypothetical protein